MISTFLKGAIGLSFCFLLSVVLKDFGVEIIIHFGGKNSDYFWTLKVLVDALILSLGKNVSIHNVKSACSIFTSGR